MKTKYLKIRMTPEDLESLKKLATGYKSVSQFVKEAIKEYSGQSPKEKLELRNRLSMQYRNIDTELSHIGGNLNQAMHRCNEASKAGLPVSPILIRDVYPKVQDCYSLLNDVRNSLYTLTDELTK